MPLNLNKFLYIVLLCALACGISLGIPGSQATAHNEDLESSADGRARLKELERDQLDAESQINVLKAKDREVSAAYSAAITLVGKQESTVATARQNLSAAKNVLAQARIDLEESEKILQAYRVQAKEVAVAAYLDLQTTSDELLLSSEELTEGVKKKAIFELVSVDRVRFVDELREVEEDNRVARQVAEKALAEVEKIEFQLTEELGQLEQDRDRQASIKRELTRRQKELLAQLDAFEKEILNVTSFVQRKEAEERARALGGSDEYIWPSDAPRGSGFGKRFHPILRIWRNHNGLDFSASWGSPVWAAHTGIVTAARFDRGFGNYVVLQHGDGTASIYAHMSSLRVRKGDPVYVGEQIGRVGSTGLSTGPHLHFEIRKNGVPVNPLNYLPRR